MGSCFSKPDKELSEKRVTGNSRSKLTTTEQRLGNKEQQEKRGGPGTTANQTGGGSGSGTGKTAEQEVGHRLGAQAESMSSGTSNTREAAARAAELRYNQQQEKLKSSQGKLKAMSKMSRQEKGL